MGTAGVPRLLLLLIHFWQHLFTSLCPRHTKPQNVSGLFLMHFIISGKNTVWLNTGNVLKLNIILRRASIYYSYQLLSYRPPELLLITATVFNVVLRNCKTPNISLVSFYKKLHTHYQSKPICCPDDAAVVALDWIRVRRLTLLWKVLPVPAEVQQWVVSTQIWKYARQQLET